MASLTEGISYAAARLPATFQVFSYALNELKRLSPLTPVSCLDVGCGPGGSYWALKETYPSMAHTVLVEPNRFMYDILKILIPETDSVEMAKADAHSFTPSRPFDLISFSYALGEMKDQTAILEKYWKATTQTLLITEPGTPAGFATILKARSFLKERGAFFIAPCGHEGECPLALYPKDWCHFSVRVGRTAAHRQIKKGNLGYEDEKFSYLIATKAPAPFTGSRILKKPLKGTGHVHLDLCTPEGIEKKIISKSAKDLYKKIKTKDWGDIL